MRWMVGIDPRELSAGAVAFARWMAKRVPKDEFIGTHVIEFEVSELFARVNPDAPTGNVPPYVDELLDPLRAGEHPFAQVGTIVASTPEDGLEAAAKQRKCDGLVIGKRNPAHGKTFVRLGRVARRLLRSLQMPVVVVPPDAAGDFSDGPILVATSLSDSSAGAAKFGAALSEQLDVDLLVTNVAVDPAALTLYMPGEEWTPIVEDARRFAHDRLAKWVKDQGIEGARTSIVEGSVGPRLQEVARTAGASMIVVGSRGLGTFDRMFLSSVGSELAAGAPIPVAVVPPDWG